MTVALPVPKIVVDSERGEGFSMLGFLESNQDFQEELALEPYQRHLEGRPNYHVSTLTQS